MICPAVNDVACRHGLRLAIVFGTALHRDEAVDVARQHQDTRPLWLTRVRYLPRDSPGRILPNYHMNQTVHITTDRRASTMRLPATILALISLWTTATSAPLRLRIPYNPGSLYVCAGIDWTGPCTYLSHSLVPTACHSIPADFAHAGSIGGDLGPGCWVYAYARAIFPKW